MKKKLLYVLPAIFLAFFTASAFAQNKDTIKQDTSLSFNNLQQQTQELKEKLNQQKTEAENTSMENAEEENLVFPIYKYDLGQTINLKDFIKQGEAKSVYLIIRLRPGKTYTLFDPKTKKPIEEKTSKYVWNNFTSKYNFSFSFALATGTNPYIAILLEPIKTKEPTIPAKIYFYSVENQDKTIDLHLFAESIDGKSAANATILGEK